MKTNKQLVTILNILSVLSALGCTVQTSAESGKSGKSKDASISTPVGSLSIQSKTDTSALGVALYPGARPKADTEEDHNNSNANMKVSSSLFGMNLVVQKYESNDAPETVLAFYAKELSKFGTVIKCEGSVSGPKVENGKDAPVSCNDDLGGEYKVALKVGTEQNQHIVAIKPYGKGSAFALVYVNVRGQKETR